MAFVQSVQSVQSVQFGGRAGREGGRAVCFPAEVDDGFARGGRDGNLAFVLADSFA